MRYNPLDVGLYCFLFSIFYDLLESRTDSIDGSSSGTPSASHSSILLLCPDSNEGVIRPGSFYAHAREGILLRTIAPTKLVEFTQDSGAGSGVRLDNGRILKPSAVILCTGYNNAYTRLFDGGLSNFSLVVDINQC